MKRAPKLLSTQQVLTRMRILEQSIHGPTMARLAKMSIPWLTTNKRCQKLTSKAANTTLLLENV